MSKVNYDSFKMETIVLPGVQESIAAMKEAIQKATECDLPTDVGWNNVEIKLANILNCETKFVSWTETLKNKYTSVIEEKKLNIQKIEEKGIIKREAIVRKNVN